MRGRFNRPGYERVAKNRQAPAGRLSRLEAIVDEHSTTLENVDGEGSVTVRKNYKGGLTIGAPPATGTPAAAEYDSLFKAYATTGESLWFGVKDGSETPLSDDRCGIVRINGTEVDVYSHKVEIESADYYYAWLFVWMDDVLGRGAEIVINNGGTPVSPVRATPMPSHIVAHGALLIGRLTVASDIKIESGPTQDYKRGGIPEMLLLGPCGNDVVVELT